MVEVLVTGGAGFIGSNFVRYALGAHPDWRITTLDKLTYAGRRENLHDVMTHERHAFVHGDIGDAAVSGPLVERANIVVHFAAETHVDRSIMAAGEFIKTDVLGTFELLEAARRAAGLTRFVQISTDEVYGSVATGASGETDELRPRNPYAASKAGADRLAYSYWATYGTPVIVTRASNNYGPYQFPEKVIPLFVTNLVDDIPVPLYGDGRNVRDWLHVLDHCAAIDLLIAQGVNGEVYNIGGGNDVMNVDLTHRILDALGKPRTLITPVPDRPGHDRRYCVDTAKLRSLGWAPRVPFEQGLRDAIEWYRVNEWWWRPIKEQDPAFKSYYRAQVRNPALSVTILVTGAAGFAGSHVVQALGDTGNGAANVVAWRRATPPPAEIAALATWEQVDLLNREEVRSAIQRLKPSAVYHCAGAPNVAHSWRDTVTPLSSNILATHRLLDALRRAGSPCRVVIPGSATVYASSTGSLTEDSPIAPANPYAVSKLAQEQLGLRAAAEDGLEVIVTRSFNHIGPRQSAAFAAPSMARQIALIERGAAEPVIKVGNLDARRDMTDVRDMVRAYIALMAQGTPSMIYNVSSGLARSMESVLDALIARARVTVRIETDPSLLRPGDTPVVLGNSARLRAATGWLPDIPFEQTLDDLLNYWRRVTVA